MSTFYNRFLAHGFAVCNVEYRMATKDKTTGNYTPNSAVAPAAVQDALAATKWFWDHADQYNVDKTRFIVTGASAGGHLALMVGLCTPAADLGPTSPGDFKIAAIVNGYGTADVADLLRRNDPATKQWLPDSIPDRDELAKRVSPMTYLRKDIPPLLTVIGSKDHGLAANQRMTDLLKKAGADADLHVVDGAGHGFATPPTAWPDAEQAIFSFLAQKKIINERQATEMP
jgi:acetyl esterase/lipase